MQNAALGRASWNYHTLQHHLRQKRPVPPAFFFSAAHGARVHVVCVCICSRCLSVSSQTLHAFPVLATGVTASQSQGLCPQEQTEAAVSGIRSFVRWVRSPFPLLPPACPSAFHCECHSSKTVTTTLQSDKRDVSVPHRSPSLGRSVTATERKAKTKPHCTLLYLYVRITVEAGCSDHGPHMDLRDLQSCLLQKFLLSQQHLNFTLICVMSTICDCLPSSCALTLDTRPLSWAFSTLSPNRTGGKGTTIEKRPPACIL